jgi:hypothetical protein
MHITTKSAKAIIQKDTVPLATNVSAGHVGDDAVQYSAISHDPVLALHKEPGISEQKAEQHEPDAPLLDPRSHCSLEALIPSPHIPLQ